MATKGKHGKIIFSESDIQFIKDHFQSMTNQQIADALGLKKTIVRMKAYELGLQRINLEYWPDDAETFLRNNYGKIGDKEMADIFNKTFQKTKGWTHNHIQKKMSQLGLKRNKHNWLVILERNWIHGSFGKPKRDPKMELPKVFIHVTPKIRLELKPGQTIEELKEKYKHLIPIK